ncbi:hypothetical protein QJS10_CPA07g01215 [Acorus calamus]|uniref:Uncharacterized protein n=1 Tax=Acorus calamus TaxID=4465 RepID=A0AAV9EGD3_ACOCL|nr:hypothetical protein QJS10_CPA07g01215 [Acorus calamus]
MGNSLRCCLACVLPCGALDMIRVVHLDGRVEEFSHPIPAREVLEAHPRHVLTKPCSQGATRRILILLPHTELKRGRIYFLIPSTSLAGEVKQKEQRQKLEQKQNKHHRSRNSSDVAGEEEQGRRRASNTSFNGLHRRCRTGGVEEWRPHLEGISEDTRESDVSSQR